MKFFKEFRRRNFCKVGIAYVVVAWLVWQIVDLLVASMRAPPWTMPAFGWTVLVGFPVVMAAAWLLELTPEGMKLQKNVDPAKSTARKTGRLLTRGIIMVLAMALVLYMTDRFRDQLRSGHDEANSGIETGRVETATHGAPLAFRFGKTGYHPAV